MIRVLCLVAGLAGAAGLSQFPEFSQQYLQRLAGQVQELSRQVKAFDADALAAGLGREEALQELSGTDFLLRRQSDMRVTFARHARLAENLMVLRAASPLERMAMPLRMTDGPTVQEVWADFTPAMPVSVAGAASAGVGFFGGWAAFAALLALVSAPFRRLAARTPPQDTRREPALRVDPPVARPTLVATPPNHLPKLAGARR